MVWCLMSRFEERKKDYKNALNRLREALQEEPTELAIDGILHRFMRLSLWCGGLRFFLQSAERSCAWA
jgi:cytochrome c556